MDSLVKVDSIKDLMKNIDDNSKTYFTYVNKIVNSNSMTKISNSDMNKLLDSESQLSNNLDELVQDISSMSSTAISQGVDIIKYIIIISIVLIIGIDYNSMCTNLE